MDAVNRRKGIMDILNFNEKAIKGQKLAEKFNVTRQVIVKDLAILKTQNPNIISTSEGYLLLRETDKKRMSIVVNHDEDKMFLELKTIIDFGVTVEDIIVEHPVYGEIKANLYLKSQRDLDNFIDSFFSSKATALSTITDGIHIHTISSSNIEDLEEVKKELKKMGFLVEEE